MARPREFCLDQALFKALNVFWRHGFEGASMSELTEAMGITRPSLYAAYGNKEELFRKALDLYEKTYMGFTHAAFQMPDARGVAETLLRGYAEAVTACGHPPGCLGTTSVLVCSEASEPIREELARRRTSLETTLRRRFEKAKATGEIPAGTHAGDLARFIMTTAQGMSIQAAGGASRQSLLRVAEMALRAWPV